MVHKRYIKRGGKTYGPYYYKNVRDNNGNVKSIYLGSKKEKENFVVQKGFWRIYWKCDKPGRYFSI